MGTGRKMMLDADELDEGCCYEFVARMVATLEESLRERFPDKATYKVLRILDPVSFRGHDLGELFPIMWPEFVLLLSFYTHKRLPFKLFDVPDDPKKPEVKIAWTEGMKKEFELYLTFMWRVVCREPGLSFSGAWKILTRDHGAVIPRMITLAQICRCIPVQSASVERGFSMHKLIKHKLRNALRLVTLDSLLRVKLLGFGSFDQWLSDAHREETDILIEEATEIIGRSGGLRSGQHPLTLGKLFKACCELDVPCDLACPDDDVDVDELLGLPSDSDQDSDEFDEVPAEDIDMPVLGPAMHPLGNAAASDSALAALIAAME